MPCAVSGRRYTTAALSSTGPMNVLNMRLNRRGSRERALRCRTPGHCARLAAGVPLIAGSSARKRALQFLQSTSGSVKPRDVTARFPDPRMHEDRRVEALDVIARAHHRVPPAILEVLLELDAERAVVPHRPGAAVDLGGLEDEAAPLAERHELLHDIGMRRHGCHDGADRARGGWAGEREMTNSGMGRRERDRERGREGNWTGNRICGWMRLIVLRWLNAGSSSSPPSALPSCPVPVRPASHESRSRLTPACRRRPAQQSRDDLVAVEPAVLDEHLVGVVPGDDHPGNEHSRHGRLERLRVVLRDAGRTSRSGLRAARGDRRSARSRS